MADSVFESMARDQAESDRRYAIDPLQWWRELGYKYPPGKRVIRRQPGDKQRSRIATLNRNIDRLTRGRVIAERHGTSTVYHDNKLSEWKSEVDRLAQEIRELEKRK